MKPTNYAENTADDKSKLKVFHMCTIINQR